MMSIEDLVEKCRELWIPKFNHRPDLAGQFDSDIVPSISDFHILVNKSRFKVAKWSVDDKGQVSCKLTIFVGKKRYALSPVTPDVGDSITLLLQHADYRIREFVREAMKADVLALARRVSDVAATVPEDVQERANGFRSAYLEGLREKFRSRTIPELLQDLPREELHRIIDECVAERVLES
jgi:hypothetical protein